MREGAVLGFIGFGNMAKAIAGGVLQSPLKERCRLIAYNPTREKISSFGGVEACESAAEAARRSDYLFICVKPQQMEEAFSAFASELKEGQILVSIAAGVSCERLRELSGGRAIVVRAMPDTPMLVGCGATAAARPKGISDTDYEAVLEVLRASGEVYEIAEDKFDEIIPLAGSGVALLFRMASLVEIYAKKQGLDAEMSVAMFAKALEGAAAMLERSGKTPAELEKMVCSKGGTTLAMLDSFDRKDFNQIFGEAFEACVERARELGGKK